MHKIHGIIKSTFYLVWDFDLISPYNIRKNMTLTILRQHYEYDLISSKKYKTTIISTIKYDYNHESLFLFPAHDVLEDLEIKDSEGRHLVVLSAKELKLKFDISKHEILNDVSDDTPRGTLDVIPILLLPSKSAYEKVFITYTSSIKEDRYESTMFNPDININFRFHVTPKEYRFTCKNYDISDETFDVYVIVKCNEDYRIINSGKISIHPINKGKIITARQNTFGTNGYFIENVGFDDILTGNIIVGLNDSLLKTAKIVTFICTVVPIVLIFIPLLFDKFFIPTLEILAGSMALLIGERFWILKDKKIMKRWGTIQRSLLLFNGLAFVFWLWQWSASLPLCSNC